MNPLDLTVPAGNGFLNVRVGAIIMKDDQFLMVNDSHADYLYSVGGRIQFGESAEEAIVREVFEETGVKLAIDRLGFIHENFFVGDLSAIKGKVVYEISFFFYMLVPDDFTPVCNNTTSDGRKEHLVWVTADTKQKYYPEFFRTELRHPSKEIKHFVTRDAGTYLMESEEI